MTRKEERNAVISQKIEEYKRLGFMVRQAIELTAKQYFLSFERVKDIYYGKKV